VPHACRLYVLPPSHFCERARWGLDRAGTAYTEFRWAPGIHAPLARRLAPRTSLPILEADGTVVQGSGAILDFLGTTGGDAALEDRFEHRIGPLVSRYLYSATLHDPGSGVRDMVIAGLPRWQRLVGAATWPLVRRAIMAGMQARPEFTATLEAEVEAELDWFDGRIGGADHLVGGGFGRADITAASILSPLAMPPDMPLYGRLRPPPAVAAALARWRARPSLKWVLRTYAAWRGFSGSRPA
jgi:glutathione S-transferase